MPFFAFPDDARWDDERAAVEFTVVLGEYRGTVRVHRRVFQRMLDQSPTPERCLEAFHLQRTRFELAVERKPGRRQLTEDGNVEITGRDLDLRERDSKPVAGVNLFNLYSKGAASLMDRSAVLFVAI